jgi:hypothetical protein
MLLAAIAAAALGAWVAFAMLGPRANSEVARDVPPELAALHGQLRSEGVHTTVSLVRREHADVRVRAMFVTQDGERRAFFVMWCASNAAGRQRADALRALSIPAVVETNGPLVLYIARWPEHDPLALAATRAFLRFDTSGLRPEGS